VEYGCGCGEVEALDSSGGIGFSLLQKVVVLTCWTTDFSLASFRFCTELSLLPVSWLWRLRSRSTGSEWEFRISVIS
jgi:hypothetical protein